MLNTNEINTAPVRRPIKFKLDAFRLFYCDRVGTAEEVFRQAAIMNSTTLSGCMIDYASSYMSDDIKNFLRKKLLVGDIVVHQYFDLYSMGKVF